MSKIQEAIEHFKSLQKRYTTQHNGKQCEFVASALEAMNDQAEREKGCEYCNGNTILGLDDANDGIQIERNDHTAIIESDTWEFPIHFCPMCGHDLRKPVE